jgi:hypothetical protein
VKIQCLAERNAKMSGPGSYSDYSDAAKTQTKQCVINPFSHGVGHIGHALL